MQDHTKRFGDRVAFYTRARPGYPSELLHFFQTRLEWSPDRVLADVGSGTGLLADPFVRYGNRVLGVEPNGPMREASMEILGAWPNFVTVDGTAEATGLAEGSVDLVTAGQAFHWFDPEKSETEFARILRGNKPVALIWNKRKRDASGFTAAYQRLVETHQVDRCGGRIGGRLRQRRWRDRPILRAARIRTGHVR